MSAADDVLEAVPRDAWLTSRAIADGMGRWSRTYAREILAALHHDGFVRRRGEPEHYEYQRADKVGIPRAPSRKRTKRLKPTGPWPQEAIDRLKALAAAGKYVDEMVEPLGKTYHAIDSKLRAMGIDFKRRPMGCWVDPPPGATEKQIVRLR